MAALCATTRDNVILPVKKIQAAQLFTDALLLVSQFYVLLLELIIRNCRPRRRQMHMRRAHGGREQTREKPVTCVRPQIDRC